MNIFDKFSSPTQGAASPAITSSGKTVTSEGRANLNLFSQFTNSHRAIQQNGDVVMTSDIEGATSLDSLEGVNHWSIKHCDRSYHLMDHTYSISGEKDKSPTNRQNRDKAIASQIGSLASIFGGKKAQTSPATAQEAPAESKFACDQCEFTTSSEEALENHKAGHSNVKYMCYLCGKLFSQESSLANHIISHAGQTTFTCEICGQVSHDQNAMMGHLTMHSETSLAVCHLCDKALSSNEELLRHQEEVHSGRKVYACSICSQQYKYKISCIKHMVRAHQAQVDEKRLIEEANDIDGCDQEVDTDDAVKRVQDAEKMRKLVVLIERLDLQMMRGLYLNPSQVSDSKSGSEVTETAQKVKQMHRRSRRSVQSVDEGATNVSVTDQCVTAPVNRRRCSDSLSVSSLDSAVDLADSHSRQIQSKVRKMSDEKYSKKSTEGKDAKGQNDKSSSATPSKKLSLGSEFLKLLPDMHKKVTKTNEQSSLPVSQNSTSSCKDKHIPNNNKTVDTPQKLNQSKNIFDDFDNKKVNDSSGNDSQTVPKFPSQQNTPNKSLPCDNFQTSPDTDLSPGKRFRNLFDDFLSSSSQNQTDSKEPQHPDANTKIAVQKQMKCESSIVKKEVDNITTKTNDKSGIIQKSSKNSSDCEKKESLLSNETKNGSSPAVSTNKTEQEVTPSQRPKRIRMKKTDSDFVYYGETSTSVLGKSASDNSSENTNKDNKSDSSTADARIKKGSTNTDNESKSDVKNHSKLLKSPPHSESNKSKASEQKTHVSQATPKTVDSKRTISQTKVSKTTPHRETSVNTRSVRSGIIVNGIENKPVQIVVNEKGEYNVLSSKDDNIAASAKSRPKEIKPKENRGLDNTKRPLRKRASLPNDLSSPVPKKNGRLSLNNENLKKLTTEVPRGRGRPRQNDKKCDKKSAKSTPRRVGRPKRVKPTTKSKYVYDTDEDEDDEDEYDDEDEENDSGVSETRSEGDADSSEEEVEEEVEAEVVYFSHDPRTGDIVLTSNPNNKRLHGNSLVNIDLNQGEMAKGDIFVNPDDPDMEYVLVDGHCLLPMTMLQPIESTIIRIDSEAEWNGQIL